ncbi:MAG: LCP family protein [Treponemataceae bacterium]|nr:LCP family protein [Treponemataceae bacterium]
MAKISLREKSSLFLIISFAVMIVAVVVITLSMQTDPIDQILNNNGILNTLFVLYDEESNEVISTDLIMYYPETKMSAMFDIPGRTGDLWKSIGRVAQLKNVYLEKGIEAYRHEIEKCLDIEEIPFTVEIELKNFLELADILGGLRVVIPSPIDIRTEENIFLLPSGSVRLDGDKVYTYLKYREEEDTYQDIQARNQDLVLSFMSAMHDLKLSGNLDRLFKKVSALMKYNIKPKYFHRLLSEISLIDVEKLKPQTITGSVSKVDGEDLLWPHYDGNLIRDSVKQQMNILVSAADETSFKRTYTLQILNGTDIRGLSSRTSSLFQSIGYNVMPPENADRNDYENTIIIDHIGDQNISSAIGKFILCDNIVVEKIKDEEEGHEVGTYDFTIILGKDFDGRYVHKVK